MTDLALMFEFIPITMEASLYKFLKKTDRKGKWRAIKDELRKKFGNKCQICEVTRSHLEAHEVWEYDDETCVQSLAGIQLLCTKCHRVKHFNLYHQSRVRKWGILQSKITKQDLIDHFCSVNDCDEAEFEKQEAKAFKILRERNRIRWKKDFGTFYKPLYDTYSLSSVDFI